MEKYYLGFDAGTQSVKAAVYDSNMQCVTEHSTPTVLRYPHPGWVEMDADQYVEAAVTSIAACTKEMREKRTVTGEYSGNLWGWCHFRYCRCR